MSSASDCAQKHPKNAAEAWGRVLPLRATDTAQSLLNDWKAERAYKGMEKERRNKGVSRNSDPNTHYPESLVARQNMDRLLDKYPTEEEANAHACVKVAGLTKEQEKAWKEQEKGVPKKKGLFGDCYTMAPDGTLTKASDAALKEHRANGGPQVSRGFYLNTFEAKKANVEARLADSSEKRQLYAQIRALEKELAERKGQLAAMTDGC